MAESLEASFSVLVMSIGSSAAISLGLAPNPQSGKVETDKKMARFNIDLLTVLKEKTKNNLNNDETQLIDAVLTDLQMHFVEKK